MIRFFIFVLFICLLPYYSFSRIYYVSPDGHDKRSAKSWKRAVKSIHKALGKAKAGDQIWLREGTYYEGKTLIVPEKITLLGGFTGNEKTSEGLDMDLHRSVVDGELKYQCFQNKGKIENLWVLNGKPGSKSWEENESGGVYNKGIIQKCVIARCQGGIFGGGIHNAGGQVLESKIFHNQARAYGGGIYNADGIVQNCTVFQNLALDDGGGIYMKKGSLFSCDIYENRSHDQGGGVYSEVNMQDCTVHGNFAEASLGGGIYLKESSAENCRVYLNAALNGAGIYSNEGTVSNAVVFLNKAVNRGGGIFSRSGLNIHCTLYMNEADEMGGGIYNDSGAKTINVISWKNRFGDILGGQISYCCFGGTQHGYESNISLNPMFENILGDSISWDFRLKNGSPCVDSGDANVSEKKARGIAREQRPGEDHLVCMGAYESPSLFIPDPVQVPLVLYVAPDGSGKNGDNWADSYKTLSNALNYVEKNQILKPVNICVKKGVYKESGPLVIPGNVTVLGGFSGKEDKIFQRDWSQHTTRFDGRNSSRVFDNYGVLDGLTITNGSAHYGGGAANFGYIVHSTFFKNRSYKSGSGVDNHAFIAYCIFVDNQAGAAGAVYNRPDGEIWHSICYENQAEKGCGGIYNTRESSIVRNSIAWANQPADIEGGVIEYSCFEKGKTIKGKHNLFSDPFFISPASNPEEFDFRLHRSSPCIDAGLQSSALAADYLGNRMIFGDACDIGAIEYIPVKADFQAVEMKGYAPFWVQFEDLSKGEVVSRQWDFMNDGTVDSIDKNPRFLFRYPGLYSVKLIVGGNAGGDVCEKKGYIRVAHPYYVAPYGNDLNNGLSWNTPFKTVGCALSLSAPGEEIFVLKGVYKEKNTLLVPKSVSVYGGYKKMSDGSFRHTSGTLSIIDARGQFRVLNNDGFVSGLAITGGHASSGAGVYNTGTLRQCRIYGNHAVSDKAKGGGLYLAQSGRTDSCMIFDNLSDNRGGGVYVEESLADDQRLILSNSLIYLNKADYGGAVYCRAGGIVNHCSIYKNVASQEGGGLYVPSFKNSLVSQVRNSILWNNRPANIPKRQERIQFMYSCFAEAHGENGNISANPRFLSVTGSPDQWDFRLKEGSACIDAAKVNPVSSEKKDLDGRDRPGKDGKSTIGAFEMPPEWIPGENQDPARLYVSDKGDNSNGLSWITAFHSIAEATDSVGSQPCEIWVAQGTYNEHVIVKGHVSLYGGFSGAEILLSERNSDKYSTIIDGQKKRQCVQNFGVLDGFSIRHGSSSDMGGGVFNVKMIRRCKIYQNQAYAASGGGVYNQGIIEDCRIYKNVSKVCGGGIYNDKGKVLRCTLYLNESHKVVDFSGRGGGIYSLDGLVENCVIYRNRASAYGGGIYNAGSAPVVNNVTLFDNYAYRFSGIYNAVQSAKIVNTISWHPKGKDLNSKGTVSFSCFKKSRGKNGNFNHNPMFRSISGEIDQFDLSLKSSSACIDRGSDDDAAFVDILGTKRPVGNSADVGAFEYIAH